MAKVKVNIAKLPIIPVKLCSHLKNAKPGELPQKLLRPIEGKGVLHHCAADAYEAMDAAANAEGIDLSPTSPADTYRTLAVQEYGFYQRYTTEVVKGKKVKTYKQNGDKSYSVTFEDDTKDTIYVSHDDWDTLNNDDKKKI